MSEALSFDLTLYPDPVLRKPASPVEAFDEDLRRTVQAMFEVMYESKGVGLAAPQVGLKLRLLVLNESGDPTQKDKERVLVNPRIVARRGNRTKFEEGCLSFPAIYAEIERPSECSVEAQDLEGQPLRIDLEGFEARIVQHEADHLEGVLLVDRMTPADKLRNRAALQELVDGYRARLVK